MWQTHPSVPPVPSQKPGVKINHRIPASMRPLYSWPTPGIIKLKIPANTGSRIVSATSTSGSTYNSRAGFVRLALAVDAPHVNDLAAEGLQHRLDSRVTLRHLAQPLFFQPRLVLAAERLAVGRRIFHNDAHAHLFAGNFMTRITHELVVVSFRKRIAEVTRVGRKLDAHLALFEHYRLRGFECRYQQHLSLTL